jgi:hypothetical protein
LQNFLNLPNAGGGNLGGGRVSSGLGNAAAAAGGALAGGAAADFLRNRPSNALPGAGAGPGLGNIASTLPANPGGIGNGGIGPGGGTDIGRPGTPGNRPADIGRPGTPGNRPADIGRPGTPGNRPADIGRPGTPGNRPGDIGRPGRPDIGQPGRPDLGRPGGPGDRIQNLPSRIGDIGRPGRPDIGQPGRPDLGRPGGPGDRIQNLPSRIGDIGKWQDWRHDHLGDVGDWWQNNWGDYGDWYGDNWWHDNHIDWPYYPGFGYWAGAAWGGLSNWVDYGWSDPIYYNYGENVYYGDDSVYYGDQVVCTQPEYIEQAEAIALNVPEAKPDSKDWMPLGVFAITQDGQPTGADPTMFLQLAVSKQGIINGTFQNTATNTAKAVEGMIDKQTQRAAWTAKGELRPIMETGIANLTQETTAVLVHFPDNTTQQALLVRLEKPGETKK